MKIGIYGGCFNPPHKAHEKIATELINLNYVDKVIFVPTGDKYPKADLEKARTRYDMINIICRKTMKFDVSRYEMVNNTTTYETLKYFEKKYLHDDIYFIMGVDNLKEFDTWNDYTKILDRFHILVLQRNHENMKKIAKKFKAYENHIILVEDLGDLDVSSRWLREEIRKNGITKNLEKYMDKGVMEYLNKYILLEKNIKKC